jgi:hypothetical protein
VKVVDFVIAYSEDDGFGYWPGDAGYEVIVGYSSIEF